MEIPDIMCSLSPWWSDTFLIPFLDGHILYLPRLGIAAGVEAKVGCMLTDLKAGRRVSEGERDLAEIWIGALDGIYCRARRVLPRDLPPFRPTHVTLSLTTGCSLRCVYCYASAGEGSVRHMQFEIAQSAIEMAARNAKDTGEAAFNISFHGEGEPTHNWPLFKACVEAGETLATEYSLCVDFTMSTNAVWGRTQRDFIGRHFKRLSVSLDGLPNVQDRQRPTPSGRGSFGLVRASLRALDEARVTYGLRATVLPDGLEDMLPFLEWAATNTRTDFLSFEPVFENGRGGGLRFDRHAFYKRFGEVYRRVQVRAAELNIAVGYSGCRPTIANGHFCQATGPNPNFVVMSDGTVSSCYEIKDAKSSKGRFTVYGRWDPKRHGFILDSDRLDRIRQFGVWDLPNCRNCFAKWNCGGDCIARCDAAFGGMLEYRPPRCELNRVTTFDEIVRRSAAADIGCASGLGSTGGPQSNSVQGGLDGQPEEFHNRND